jgi:tRNA-guanine family transglycosylase
VTVGTKGTVKSLTTEQVKDLGAQVVLANTYHLYLEPGDEMVKKMGGLGQMMQWSGPTMTDSGGFQAFSLGVAYEYGIGKFISSEAPQEEIVEEAYDTNRKNKKAKITEDGVEFQSVIDGSTHFFSPEKSIQIQKNIGADIIFAFDECTSPHAGYQYLKESMERTHR